MTFDQIQYFIAIAECNTYFDAAEELNISQSALSKQIIKLEKELGVALLDPFPPQGPPLPPPERPFTRTPWPFAGSMRS